MPDLDPDDLVVLAGVIVAGELEDEHEAGEHLNTARGDCPLCAEIVAAT